MEVALFIVTVMEKAAQSDFQIRMLLLVPLFTCHIIMCSRIYDHMIAEAFTQSFRLHFKLQYPHAVQIIGISERMHLRTQITEVLYDDFYIGQYTINAIKQIIGRTFDPFSFNRRITGCRYFPIRIKGTKMIDANNIKLLFCPSQAFDPKAVAILFHPSPMINRIAPTLTGPAEIIRRYTGHK